MEDKDLFRTRRVMAQLSFSAILLTLFSTLGIVMFGSKEVADNLLAASGITSVIITALVAQISHYSHLVHLNDKEE